MKFDISGARRAGYSDDEIAAFLAEQNKFDLQGAINSGYSSAEVVDFLVKMPEAPKARAPVDNTQIDYGDAATSMQGTPGPSDNRGLIARLSDAFKPAPKPSVMEGFQPTPQQRQAEIDQRLSYGAGPISQQTVQQAADVRAARARTTDPLVSKVAKSMERQNTPTIEGLIQRTNNATVQEMVRDEKAAEFRSAGEWAIDTLSGLSQGAVSLAQLPINIIAPSSEIAETLRKTQKEWQAAESDVLKAQRDQLRQRVQEEEGFFDKYAATVVQLVTSPALTISEAAKQVPMFLGVLGASRLGAAAAGTGVNVAGRVSPTVALSDAISGGAIQAGARTAGSTAGGVGASMVMAGGDAAGGVYEKLTDPKQTPMSVWEKNEDFQRLTAQGKTAGQAIEEIATTKARMAAMITAPLGLLGFAGAEAAIASRGLGKATRDALTFGGAGKLIAKDLIGEQLEEGGTQAGSNVIARTVDPNVKLTEGVPEAMAQALVTAAPFSVLGAASQAQEAARAIRPTNFTPSGSPTQRAGMVDIVIPVPDAPIAVGGLDVSTAGSPSGTLAGGVGRESPVAIGSVDVAGRDLDRTAGLPGGAIGGVRAGDRQDDALRVGLPERPANLTGTSPIPRASDADLLARTEAAISENNNAVVQPSQQWFGRKGDGYATEADAGQALPGRQRMFPALDWKVEQMPSGKYRLAGYSQETNLVTQAAQTVESKTQRQQATQVADATQGVVSTGETPARATLELSGAERAGLKLALPAPASTLGAVKTALVKQRGVEVDAIPVAELNDSQRVASAVGRLLGRTVTFVRAVKGDAQQVPNGMVNRLGGKHIFIASNTDDAPLTVTMHEAYHGLPAARRKQLNAALLETFASDRKGEFQTEFGYDDAKFEEEAPAMIAQAVSKRADFWEELRTKMGNKEFGEVAKVILDKLTQIVTGAKKEYGDAFVSKYIKDVDRARSLLTDAYAEAMKAQGKQPEVEGVEIAASERSMNERLQQRIDEDFDAAVAEYSALKDAEGGKLIDTDLVRELSPEYRADKTRAAEVHDAASNMTQRMFEARVDSAPPKSSILFMAGGGGAGKSTAKGLLKAQVSEAHTVLDGTLSSYDKAKRNVERALSKGHRVAIAYIYREPVEALKNGVLSRAMKTRRAVPLDALVKGHAGSSEVVRKLQAEFGDNPNFVVYAIDNSRGSEKAALVPLESITPVIKSGLKERLLNATETEYQTGRIDGGIYRATLKGFPDAAGATRSSALAQEDGQNVPGVVQGRPGPVGSRDAVAQASPAEVRKAEAYERKNGILPYVSEGQLEVDVDPVDLQFSLKTAGKYGNHPVLDIPLNKNGTVTLYYPTTNTAARQVSQDRKLRGATPEANRIYLTNESSGPKVMQSPGNIEQPMDGANVLIHIDPSLLQLDQEHSDGRKDFFVQIAEGEAFNRKMKQVKLFTLNAPRDRGLSPDATIAGMTDRITAAIDRYKNMTAGDKRIYLREAKAVLKREHNVGTLLGENGKLEKTRVGDYGLTYEGKSVASLGLGLASAQRINDKQKLTTCPKSAICESLCLGETSGQNRLYGGEGQFKSGPRLSQYLKTEAMVVHPEEFAVVLYSEIERFRKKADKEDFQVAIRLNVTSDFKPSVFEAVIRAFPDVMFYDYTKLSGNDAIAPNHHLTYSSTGASQVVDGKKVVNRETNWNRMVQRMRDGFNVAMAFTSRTSMPAFVEDDKTGERFQVWNGDNYDARFLDPKPGQEGNLLNKGMIVGLTNKDRTTKPEDAAVKHNGFFLDYDPARDGDTLIIQDQDALAQSRSVIPIAPVRESAETVQDIGGGTFTTDAAAADVELAFSERTKPDPVKTVKAYKLFRVDARRPGLLFPLFVDANKPVPMNTWLDADVGAGAAPSKTGKPRVKSKLGPLAYRPGWHAGDLPLATHIGGHSVKGLNAPDIRKPTEVWAEVEMAADRDWQTEANKRGINKAGKLIAGEAHITDQVPEDGYYRYKTNSNMTGNWLIGGSMKVTRILSDAEVEQINSAAGVADLPRQKPFDAAKFGFANEQGELAAGDRNSPFEVSFSNRTKMAPIEEPGQFDAKPGEEITVVRLASMPGLDNTNAASPKGLATYLSMVDDFESAAGGEAQASDTIYVYRVKVPEGGFGGYSMQRGGRSVVQEGGAQTAGRTKAKYGGYWYSFPQGTEAALLGSIPLNQARASLGKVSDEIFSARQEPGGPPYTPGSRQSRNFDFVGTKIGGQGVVRALQDAGFDFDENGVAFSERRRLPVVSPQSALDADIRRGAAAVKRAVERLRVDPSYAMSRQPIVIGRLPHVLGLLNVPTQDLEINPNILNKIFVEKHASEFASVTPEQFVRALYRPAMVLQSRKLESEKELVLPITGDIGAVIVPINTASAQSRENAFVISAYQRRIVDPGDRNADTILRRINEGAVRYIDLAFAKPALTGRPNEEAPTKSRPGDRGDWFGDQRSGTTPSNPLATSRTSPTQMLSEAGRPFNKFFVPWPAVAPKLRTMIAEKKVKTDIDLMRWIGNNYKAESSPQGLADTPAFSNRAQTETPAFKRWFGDSKVVDAEGKPLVVYHGTNNDFNEFRPSQKFGDAYFASESKRYANAIAAGDGGNVMPVFVSLKNPRVIPFSEYNYYSLEGAMTDASVDGLIAVDENGVKQVIVAFESTQIKSATGNSGTFDPENPDITASNRRQRLSTIGSRFTLPAPSMTDDARRALQDDALRMKRVIDAVSEQGGTVTEAQNFYDANTLMPGRIQAAMDDFKSQVVQPMIDKAVRYDIDLDELALYAYAKHAEERNNYIASINNRMPDGGSGMTTADANTILQQVQSSPKAQQYEELHRDLMAIASTTRQIMLSEGLITQDEFLSLDGAYANYIPLRGLENVDDEGRVRPGVGRGFNIRGKETIRALGRRSRASDLIENVLRDYERVVMRVEKNDVGKVLLDFVLSNPDPDLWDVDVQRSKPSFNKTTGLVQYTKQVEKGEDTIGVKVGGQQVYIKLADTDLARAIRQSWKDEVSGFERAVVAMSGWWNNWMRNMLTRYNPAFAAINIPRDALWSGTTAALAELGAKGLASYLANYPQALLQSSKSELGGQTSTRYQEFRNSGGITGGFYMRGLEDIQKDLRNEMLAAGAKPRGAIERIKAARTYKLARLTLKALEFLGAASENATRFALFAAARDVGRTPVQAALLAKNGTTNFNRKGEWGGALNNLYLFYNAAVQGTAQLVRVLRSPAVVSAMAGVAGIGAMLAFYGASAGGEDDDGEAYWDKIPSYVKERNMVIMLPPGEPLADGIQRVGKRGRYFTVPVQFGFNIFPNLGYVIADSVRNQQDPKRGLTPTKAALHMTSVTFGSINPFGGAVDVTDGVQVLLAVMPTLADLPIQLATERGTFGTPSAPTKSPFDKKPDSERMFTSQQGTVPARIAQVLNEMTGGNAAKEGALSVTPGTIQTLISSTTGGLGSFIEQVGSSILAMSGDDKDIKAAKIPFLNKFYGEVDETANIRTAGDRAREIKKVAEEVKEQARVGLEPKLDDDEKRLLNLAGVADAYNQAISQMRKQEIQIIRDPKLTEAQKTLERRQIQVERDKMATEVNREYLNSLGAKR